MYRSVSGYEKLGSHEIMKGIRWKVMITFQVGVQVVTDLCVVKDTDPIPMGFIAIDYTADSSKSLALRYYFRSSYAAVVFS